VRTSSKGSHDIGNMTSEPVLGCRHHNQWGTPRKGSPRPVASGWVSMRPYHGKPLIGSEEKPVPQEPRQKTGATTPQTQLAMRESCLNAAGKRSGLRRGRCHLHPVWTSPYDQAIPQGRASIGSPMPYSPDNGILYDGGYGATSASNADKRRVTTGGGMRRYTGGGQAEQIGSTMKEEFHSDSDAPRPNKIA